VSLSRHKGPSRTIALILSASIRNVVSMTIVKFINFKSHGGSNPTPLDLISGFAFVYNLATMVLTQGGKASNRSTRASKTPTPTSLLSPSGDLTTLLPGLPNTRASLGSRCLFTSLTRPPVSVHIPT